MDSIEQPAMTDQEQPEQWAQKLLLSALIAPTMTQAELLIQRAFTERTAELVADNAKLREALEPVRGTGTIMLEIAKADADAVMWERRWKALRALNYHNTNFSDSDGRWTLADFITYAGYVCGFLPTPSALAQQDTTDNKSREDGHG